MFSGQLKFSDEDDDFFGDVPSNNNLANIFGTSMDIQADTSLKYKPPKKDNSFNNNGNENSITDDKINNNNIDWKIIVAEVVIAYKLITNENIPQGKLGLAFLHNTDKDYKIILYRTKTKILSTTNLTLNKKIYLKNNYIQFEDNDNQFWSVIFEKSNYYEIFLKEIDGKCLIEIENNNAVIKVDNATTTKDDTDSQTDILIESKEAKANILSRMAKMGQAIAIPKFNNSNTEMTDSSDSESKRVLPAKPIIQARKVHYQKSSEVTTNVVPFNQNQKLMQNSQLVMIPSDSTSINMLLTENRTQNSEIRMNLLKLDSKIDRVIDRFDNINLGFHENNREDEIIRLEEKLLELKKENRSLRKLTNGQNVDEVEDLKKTIEMLEQENEKVNNKYEEFKINSKNQDVNLIESQNRLKELEQKFEDQSENVFKLTKTNTSLNIENKELIGKIDEITTKNNNNLENIVKEIINNLYHKVCDQFQEQHDYNRYEILKIIGKTIKTETTNELKRLNNL